MFEQDPIDPEKMSPIEMLKFCYRELKRMRESQEKKDLNNTEAIIRVDNELDKVRRAIKDLEKYQDSEKESRDAKYRQNKAWVVGIGLIFTLLNILIGIISYIL